MKQRSRSAAAVLVLLSACQSSSSLGNTSTTDVTNAFSSLPLGFSSVQSTFADSSGTEWEPGDAGGGGGGPHHGRGSDDASGGGMMCGGLGGSIDLGLGFGDRDLLGGDTTNCAYDASSGRVKCSPQTRDGLTVNRSVAYTDASGATQQTFDSTTTNTVNVQIAVQGTRQGRDGNSRTVDASSDRTVSGLADGSSQRTIDGTSSGRETTSGSDSVGTFTAVRVIGDTIQGVVTPNQTDAATYPTAGTIVRSMQVTATYQGQTPTSSSRREVVTFDGSNRAAVVIIQDGETQHCTLDLSSRQLSCS
jgi:hypothetical protein